MPQIKVWVEIASAAARGAEISVIVASFSSLADPTGQEKY